MPKYDKPLEQDEPEAAPLRYRLPFGLCKRYGIDLAKSATPRDAWRALEGFGINPDAEYEKLRTQERRAGEKERKTRKTQEKLERKKQSFDPEHSPEYDYSYVHNPGKIAGVEKGAPMSFEKADSKNPNPFYSQDREMGGELFGYTTNCQTCVVAFEARLRGYDVTALPNNRNPYIRDLAKNTRLAYKDPVTGDLPKLIRKDPFSKESVVAWLRKSTASDSREARYNLVYGYKGTSYGHIVEFHRGDGYMEVYDPQSGRRYHGASEINRFFNTGKEKDRFRMYRVDNQDFSPEYVNYILKGAKTKE